jgi:RNA polymerase sigma factor (sigma-70 family)
MIRRIVRATNASPSNLGADAIAITEFESSTEAAIITEEISRERKEELLAAMRALTKRQREAVRLKFYHNLKNEEIAQQMSIKVEAVYNLISKSLVVLKKSYHRVSTLTLLGYFFPFL